jgi:hypothetical protein
LKLVALIICNFNMLKESIKRHCFLKSKRRNMFYAAYCFNQQMPHTYMTFFTNEKHSFKALLLKPSLFAEMMHPIRSFSSSTSRPRLSDEKINPEAYIQQYLEFSQQKNPVPYNSLLLEQ